MKPEQTRKKGGCKKFLVLTGAAVLILFAGLIGGYAWLNNQIFSSQTTDNTLQKFTVTSGDSVDKIAVNLESSGLIRNKHIFSLYVRYTNINTSFKAGEFLLNPSMSLDAIAQELTQTPTKTTIWITLKEGLTYKETIAEIIKQTSTKTTKLNETELLSIIENPDKNKSQLSTTAQSFLEKFKPADKNLEGFLYPETYNIATDITAGELVSLLINTLEQKLGKENIAKVVSAKYSFYQMLIIASILEREANNPTDFALVAGILYNRIERGMRLDADATTLYGLGRRFPVPTKRELEDTSNLFNTRAVSGLTPTPIGNPGKSAFLASLAPTKTDYLYYLTGRDGKMYYAKTYSEHNKNISLYL